ncbi:MAG: NADH:ubiquinone reductase (Na(+)-transporting) subunit B [Planctomycetota bacterium]
MRFLRNLVDKQRKLYHGEDSKFHKVWPLFDALETFLFAPDFRAGKQRVHCRDYVDLKRVMNSVIIAMVPCLLWAIWNNGVQHFDAVAGLGVTSEAYTTGWLQGLLGAPVLGAEGGVSAYDTIVFGLQRMVPIIVVSYGVGLMIEGLFSVVRKEEVSEGYLVSGMLIALIVPASTPLWQLAIGVAFSVVLGKEVFGGTGMNIFNPAMMVRAFLFFAFPAQMSGDAVWVAGNGGPSGVPGNLIDGYSEPTALAVAKAAVTNGQEASAALASYADGAYSHYNLFMGNIPGSAGEMSKLMVLIGAAILLVTGVGSWRTMLGGVLGMLGAAFLVPIMAAAGGLVPDASLHLAPWEHLLCGGFLFGIVFMATDPVSSPETNIGKWIYGVLIGVFTILVRMINPAYPEGTMLAILLLNAFAPTIDHFVVSANIKRRLARA